MKNILLLPLLLLFCGLQAQTGAPTPSSPEFGTPQNPQTTIPGPKCPADPCPCFGGYTQMKVYFFGVNNSQIAVFSNSGLTTQIANFGAVANGQLLTLSGAGLLNGVLPYYSYLRVTEPGGRVCTTKLYTACPENIWPNSLEETKVVGRTFGDFTVYSAMDKTYGYDCDLSGELTDWHVGGNVVGAAKNQLGTLNNESMVFIASSAPQGILTNNGRFGLGTLTPTEKLDVNGNTRLGGNATVTGIATVTNNTASTAANNGALVVTGGAGIGQNLNVGANAAVNGNATVAGIATVTNNTASTGANNGALVVTGGAGIGQNLNVGGTGRIGSNTPSTASNNGALVVTGGTGIGQNLNVGGNMNVTGTGHFTGRVTIGTNNTPAAINIINTANYSLFVADGILSEEMLVNSGWADHVFSPDYPLPTLDQVEDNIREQGCLPGMPTAFEVETQGLKLGESAVNQQVKIEELFLYLIDLKKEVKTLKEENAVLKNKMAKLEKTTVFKH